MKFDILRVSTPDTVDGSEGGEKKKSPHVMAPVLKAEPFVTAAGF